MDILFWLVALAIAGIAVYIYSRRRNGRRTRNTSGRLQQPNRDRVTNPRANSTPSSPGRSQSSTIAWPSTPNRTPSPKTYRPKAPYTLDRTVNFQTAALDTTHQVDLDTTDLVDALTGAALQPTAALYQCSNCKVFYQQASYDLIVAENHRRCVSCLQTTIVSVSRATKRRGRNATINRITLENYRDFVGRVITFEGRAHTVLISRRGTDYAVMFEKASWTRGFKMVIFERSVQDVGGERFILNLAGHNLKIRGLLAHDDIFGYEIIVNDPSMILEVT